MYSHCFIDDTDSGLPVGKVVCVGRNYAGHAAELGNAVPKEPVLFIKPATAAVGLGQPIVMDTALGVWHYETEIALLIGARLTRCREAEAREAIVGIGVGMDFTLRELQTELKASGLPWEKAKAFDGSCALSKFVPAGRVPDLDGLSLRLLRNGRVAQEGNTADMLFPMIDLICHITRFFTLVPGDVVLTGTPEGVGALAVGDRLRAELPGLLSVETRVVAGPRRES